jgi:tetratricopeptide (TPR) repeat protein
LVLTSRSLLQGKLVVLEIRELKTEAALQLLTKWAEPNQQTLLDNPALASSLCNRLGCLPLALTLVGSWLKISQETLPIAIAELEQNGLESEVLEPYEVAPEDIDPNKNIKQGLKAVLMVIWQQLSPDAQQLGRVLSLFEPINLPWELAVSVVQAYPKQSESPPVRKSWWQRFWDSLGQLVWGLLPFLARPVMLTQSAFVPIRNLKKAEIELRTKNLLQSVETVETYRLHRLVHEFFGVQWTDSDREGWVNAWVRGLSDRAQEIPASADWEQVTTWQPLRPHLESAKKIAENLRHTAKIPAAIAAYKSQANNLMAGCFRLNQAPIFEATYRQAISKHDSAKAALAKGQNALAQNYFDEARKGYQRAIEQARVALPDNSTILAGYLYRISELFYQLGNYSAGIPPAEEVVKIAKIKAKSLKLALYLNNLAALYKSQGRYEEAEPLYKQSLSLWQELLGERHPNFATSINNLAALYESQGRYEEAESLDKQSLSLRQEVLGERHPDVVTSINNLALLYCLQGRYEEAEPLLKQALVMHQEVLGERHPNLATSINNLAGLYYSQRRYEEAEPLLKQALSLRQELLGERHPDVATSINNLAGLYDSQGRYEEAESLYVKALEILEISLGNEHPHTKACRNSLQSLRDRQTPPSN